MCLCVFSGFWPGEPVDMDKLDKLDKIGHTMSRHNRARCEENGKATNGNQQNQTKWTLPAPNSIEFGAGKVHLEPEWPILEPERDKKTPREKLSSISPCFKG